LNAIQISLPTTMKERPMGSTPATTAPTSETHDKGLRRNAIGLGRIVALGLAAVAPAYSLAVTLGFVVGAVGLQTPAAFLLGFVPILFTAFAFRDLNQVMPDCGGQFVWISRALGPVAGWFFGGWVPQIATFIATAALAEVATVYLLDAVGLSAIAANPLASTSVAVILIALSAAIAVRGIELAAWVQYALIALQILAIGGFCVGAFTAMSNGTAPGAGTAPSLAWFNPFAVSDPGGLVTGVVLCLFIYWGWDSLIAVNEETTERSRTPGRAVLISTIILLVLYCGASVAAIGFGGTALITDPKNINDVLSVLGPQATGQVFGHIITLAIGLSALACLFTVALSTPRQWLSMATYRALPATITRVHPTHRTPHVATYWWAGISIVTIVLLTLLATDFIGLAILAIGVMIAAYYAATAVAAIVYFAPDMRRNPGRLIVAGVLPGLGAAMMLVAFVVSAVEMAAPDYVGASILGVGTVFWIGIGALAIGVVVTFALRRHYRDFFSGRTIPTGRFGDTDFVIADPVDADHRPVDSVVAVAGEPDNPENTGDNADVAETTLIREER
jgi:amino acid transporter